MQQHSLFLYNSLTRQLELFKPITSGQVGIYLCGPTVYGPAHLGHARSALIFDVLVNYFKYHGYRTVYVRNITDVGHLLHDADEGEEDKVAKQALQEQRNPMAVADFYTRSYEADMALLGIAPPDISPRATGHLIEQINLVQTLLDKGFAYVHQQSVYFNLTKYQQTYPYGELSGHKTEELRQTARMHAFSGHKRNPLDFTLWKHAPANHIMQWPSPWGQGFPGWHLECTAMNSKYLGLPFDIHGGGLDLCFPHHECELAQAQAAYGKKLANYWIHHQMVTIQERKMSKSAGNYISLQHCFHGGHPLLTRGYPPMALRLLLLQAHYRSPLQFSEEALAAAEKAYHRLLYGAQLLEKLTVYAANNADQLNHSSPASQGTEDLRIAEMCMAAHQALHEDLHTAKALGVLFELLRIIHLLANHQLTLQQIGSENWHLLQHTYQTILGNILGLLKWPTISPSPLLNLLLKNYLQAKQRKDYAQVDFIRQELRALNIVLYDGANEVTWSFLH